MAGFLKTSSADGVDIASSQFVKRQISATLLEALKDQRVLSNITESPSRIWQNFSPPGDSDETAG